MKIVDDPGMLVSLESQLFDELDSNQLELIAPYLQSVEFAIGETIFNEGDEGTFACFIVDGQLDVCKDNDGQPVLIAILGRGRAIGEMAVVDESLRSASVVARSDGKMLLLHRDRFAELIEAHPRIGVLLLLRIARMMSMSLRKTSAAVAELLA